MWGRQERRQVHRGRKKANGSNGKGGRERGGIGHVAVLGRAPEGARTQRWGKARKRLKEENRREWFFYPRSGRLNQVKLAEAASEELKSGKLDLRQEIFCCATGSCLSTDTSVSENVQAFP